MRCGADDRQALEQLCRYITRPALANERVQTNAAGQVVLRLKTPWRDGTPHLVMSPLENSAKLRALVVPQEVLQEVLQAPKPPPQASKARRVRGELRASPPGAAELGQVTQARI